MEYEVAKGSLVQVPAIWPEGKNPILPRPSLSLTQKRHKSDMTFGYVSGLAREFIFFYIGLGGGVKGSLFFKGVLANLVVSSIGWCGQLEYKYDSAGRLVEVSSSVGGVVEYAIDAVGNRVQIDSEVSSGFASSLAFSDSYKSVEENEGTILINVLRTGVFTGGASVKCSTSDGTAVGGSDFYPVDVTLTWSDGEGGSKQCYVTIIYSGSTEGNEQFYMHLDQAVGAELVEPSAMTVVIEED